MCFFSSDCSQLQNIAALGHVSIQTQAFTADLLIFCYQAPLYLCWKDHDMMSHVPQDGWLLINNHQKFIFTLSLLQLINIILMIDLIFLVIFLRKKGWNSLILNVNIFWFQSSYISELEFITINRISSSFFLKTSSLASATLSDIFHQFCYFMDQTTHQLIKKRYNRLIDKC